MSAPGLESRRPGAGRLAGFALLLSAVSWALGAFAAWPWTASEPDAAVIRVAFKHVAAFEAAAAGTLSPEDLAKLPRHMRPSAPERGRTGRRVDTLLTVDLDGRRLVERQYRPGGLRRDGPTYGYEELPARPGRHLLEVALADRQAASVGARRWRLRQDIALRPGQALLVEFSEEAGLTVR